MLWESTDPDAALRERFGFASFDAAADWATASLESSWGLTLHRCTRLAISDRNVILWATGDGRDVVVKWSDDEARFGHLERSSRLLAELADQGLPVPTPLPTPDGDVRLILPAPVGPLSVTVLPELGGDWLDIGDSAAVRAAGACLARLHRALATIDHRGWPPVDRRPLPVRIQEWLDAHDRGFAPAASLRLRDLLSTSPVLDEPLQLVHNDFRAANILTDASQIVGVLDFDDVLVDHRVGDLARASTYLGTRFTSWGPTPISAQRELRAGYESVRPFSPAESAWLEILTLWRGIGAVPDREDAAGWGAEL